MAPSGPGHSSSSSELGGEATLPAATLPGDPSSSYPASQAPAARPLDRGDAVGRYVVLDQLGAGGMGVVYAAFDPDLDRKVAVKLVRAAPGESEGTKGAQDRLLREAQAMAKLSHPNVVAVHDVGVFQSQVFIAMEFVEGSTLTQWLARERHEWRKIVEVFVLAARGLAAAHRAGLVHRDFKPDNVLVGVDGRVRVTDFGLARVERVAREEVVVVTESSALSPALELTRPGSLMGTPAYMSPEQFDGQAADARSDQFSFCVALYEALYGQRPFGGSDLPSLMMAVLDGKLQPPPARSGVPAWLRALVSRGLSSRPDRRWSSMDELLTQLERDPGRRWRIAIGSVVAAGLAGALGLAWGGALSPEPCTMAEAQLEEIWDAARRDALGDALARGEGSHRAETARRVERILDDYSQAWVSAHTDACKATHVRREQSEEGLDLRMGCLARRKSALRAVLGTLMAESLPPDGAIDAALGLPAIDPCADLESLRSAVTPPPDEATRVAVDAARDGLADVEAARDAGAMKPALERAREVHVRAGEIGYAPLEAEAQLALGRLEWADGDRPGGRALVSDAVNTAVSTGHDEVTAHATTVLTSFEIADADLDTARVWLAQSEAWQTRLGEKAAFRLPFLRARADLLSASSDHPQAEETLREALALAVEEHGEEHPTVAEVHLQLGRAYWRLGDSERSRRHAEQSLAIQEAVFGPMHPRLATSLQFVAHLEQQRGELDAAQAHLERALAVREDAYGKDHSQTARVLGALGLVAVDAGRTEEGVELYRRAIDIIERDRGKDHVSLASHLGNLSSALQLLGRLEDSVEVSDRAVGILERAFGPTHDDLAGIRYNTGITLLDLGRTDDAMTEFEAAYAIWSGNADEDHWVLTFPLYGMARAHFARGELDAALGRLDRFFVLASNPALNVDFRGSARFLRAKVLWELADDRPRAIEEARTAHGELAAETNADDRRELEAWLRERGVDPSAG